MLSVIIDSSDYKIKIYLKDNKYYGIKYSNGIYTPIQGIQDIIDLFKLGKNSVLIEKIKDIEVYLDKDTNYKHYIKNGIEDFLMFFSNNGEDLIEFISSNKSKSNYKRFRFKDKIVKVTATFMIFISTFASIDNTCALNIDNYIYTKEYIQENYKDITIEEVDKYLNSNDFVRENNILMNEELFRDILPYITDLNRKIELRSSLKNLKIRYYGENNMFYDTAAGYYNPFNPNTINISENYKENKHVYNHEFIHLLEDSDLIYLKEALAEIFCFEYYKQDITTYFDEVYNIKLLTEIVGKEVIFKAVFQNDYEELFNIFDNYLDETDSKIIKEILLNNISNYKEINRVMNNKLNVILFKLYYNLYDENMLDNKNIFDENNNLVYKIYFNSNKSEVMSIYRAFQLNLIKIKKIVIDRDYINDNNIKDYLYDEIEEVYYINVLEPTIAGVIIDEDKVIFESKDTKYDMCNNNMQMN